MKKKSPKHVLRSLDGQQIKYQILQKIWDLNCSAINYKLLSNKEKIHQFNLLKSG